MKDINKFTLNSVWTASCRISRQIGISWTSTSRHICELVRTVLDLSLAIWCIESNHLSKFLNSWTLFKVVTMFLHCVLVTNCQRLAWVLAGFSVWCFYRLQCFRWRYFIIQITVTAPWRRPLIPPCTECCGALGWAGWFWHASLTMQVCTGI